MMHKLKVRANHTVYIIFAVLSLFSLTLIFNDNIWFDEAYTLSLIQHNYSDIINILKSDMHPPLYFLSLKTLLHLWILNNGNKNISQSVTLQRCFWDAQS